MPPKRILTPEEKRIRSSLIKDMCVYCGDEARSKDHFRPVVGISGLPSGYCDDDWNIVPSCITCNSSKGSRDWLSFMLSVSPRSPLGRGKTRNAHRIKVLRMFEKAGAPYVQRWPAGVFTRELILLKTRLGSLTNTFSLRLQTLMRNVFQRPMTLKRMHSKMKPRLCNNVQTRSSKHWTWVLPHRVRTRGMGKRARHNGP